MACLLLNAAHRNIFNFAGVLLDRKRHQSFQIGDGIDNGQHRPNCRPLILVSYAGNYSHGVDRIPGLVYAPPLLLFERKLAQTNGYHGRRILYYGRWTSVDLFSLGAGRLRISAPDADAVAS